MYSYEANGRGNTSATDAKLLERKSQFINLPAVTPEDDGTVLGVADGKWQPINGGALDLFVVNLLDSEEAESGHTIDKTYEEIINAINENKVVILKYYYDVYTLRTLYVGDDLCFAFTRFYMQDTYAGGFGGTLFVSNEGYLVSPDDVVTEYYKGFSVQADADD